MVRARATPTWRSRDTPICFLGSPPSLVRLKPDVLVVSGRPWWAPLPPPSSPPISPLAWMPLFLYHRHSPSMRSSCTTDNGY
jgi:hypothetical protein